MRQIPFTLLTGALGAGKTTLLNRLLARPQRRLAVLVNDLGKINVDRRLLEAQAGDIIELSGGCVCCEVDLSRDLWSAAADLIARAQPDQLVLETTGIADPSVLLKSIEEEAWPRRALGGIGVVCVVDAHSGARTLRERNEARGQVAAADRVIVSKLDLAPPPGVTDAPGELRGRLRALAEDAEIASFPPGVDGDHALFDFALRTQTRRARRVPLAPHHHGQVDVVTLVADGDFDGAALLDEVRRLVPRLLRVKGFVRLAGGGGAFLELAGGRLALTPRERPARTELVLIGEALDEVALRGRLWACAATS